jgi:phage terminase small subunit
MKGRKPKDLALKILNGNPGKRPMASDSSGPFVAELPKKPRGLDRYASQQWDQLVESLAPILSPASAGILFVAVSAYSELMHASKALEGGKFCYRTKNQHGSVMLRTKPEVAIRDRARAAYHRALSELGASPVGHTRVKKLPGPEQMQLPGIRGLLG